MAGRSGFTFFSLGEMIVWLAESLASGVIWQYLAGRGKMSDEKNWFPAASGHLLAMVSGG